MSMRAYLEQVRQHANIESVCRGQNLTILRLVAMLTAAGEALVQIQGCASDHSGVACLCDPAWSWVQRESTKALATLDALAQETP